ncbi:MAG: hypothetical protein M1455_07000 [Actinobacteria bacterium]|nr:hypothetical protein [Actinomycetota bacterium]
MQVHVLRSSKPQIQRKPTISATKIVYDELGNKLQTIDPTGNQTRSVYDNSGVCATFDRLGNLSSTIRSITKDNLSISGAVDQRGYMTVDLSNAAGITNTTDQRDNSVNNTYSAAGSLASRVGAGYSPYKFSYNVLGLPDNFADPLGNQIRFAYDDLGRLSQRNDPRTIPIQITQSFMYDKMGRITSRTDTDSGASSAVIYSYDNDGRLLSVSNPNSTVNYVSYTYDNAGNVTKAAYGTGANNSVSYEHNFMNGLTRVTDDWSSNFASYSWKHG